MRIYALDPGTEESGWCLYENGTVLELGISPNPDVLWRLMSHNTTAGFMAIEMMYGSRGQPISKFHTETIYWSGRFVQAWCNDVRCLRISRENVKRRVCGTVTGTDKMVRLALIDIFGVPGTKKNPGPTFGFTSHMWAALATAYATEQFLSEQTNQLPF